MRLHRNRPARIAGARVIAGNIRRDVFAAKTGGARALKADIWVKDSRRPWKTYTVRAGQLFDIAGRRVVIAAVESDAVVLELHELPSSTVTACTS